MNKKKNNIVVKSSIKGESFSYSLTLKKNDINILTIKVRSYQEYCELYFEIYNIYLSWLERKSIKKTIDRLEERVKLVELVNREYYLRIWLKFIGFKESVCIPEYFELDNKMYDYIVSTYK